MAVEVELTVLHWVLGARVDGGLDSRLRGNDRSQGLRRFKRDCLDRKGRIPIQVVWPIRRVRLGIFALTRTLSFEEMG